MRCALPPSLPHRDCGCLSVAASPSARGRGLDIMQLAYRGAGWRSKRTVVRSETAHARTPPAWLVASLRRMGVVGAHIDFSAAALCGGISSDIYRVDLPSATICVKRALPKLKVAADWHAPPE